MPSHYLNQCWNIVNWTLRNKLQWNFNPNSYIFIQLNTFENVICRMASILSRPQFINSLWQSDAIWHRRSWSTLVQVMTGAWWHQAITWTNVDLPLTRSSGIHPRAIFTWLHNQSPSCVWNLHIWNHSYVSQGPMSYESITVNHYAACWYYCKEHVCKQLWFSRYYYCNLNNHHDMKWFKSKWFS